jgi:hypothetical protein
MLFQFLNNKLEGLTHADPILLFVSKAYAMSGAP